MRKPVPSLQQYWRIWEDVRAGNQVVDHLDPPPPRETTLVM